MTEREGWKRISHFRDVMDAAGYALVQWTRGDDDYAEFHVLPVNDLKAHEEQASCWCNPDIKRLTKRGYVRAATMVVHHSEDGRELVGEHGAH